MPLVSICLPNLNMRRFLEPRMESIMSQTMTDWELIVCDSHSDDGSWEYFQTFANDPRVRLYQVPREGIYAGWNECLRRAMGEYVYIATADDTCSPELLERMVGALEREKQGARSICLRQGSGGQVEQGDLSQSTQSAQRGGSEGELRSDKTTLFSASSASSGRNISGGEKDRFSQSTQSAQRGGSGGELRSDRTTLFSASSASSARNISGDEKDRFSQSTQSAQRGGSGGELRSDNTTLFSAASANSARNISGGTDQQLAKPTDIAVCDFDFIDADGAVIDPPPRGTARTFYGEWLDKPHIRSGELELLVHLLIDISWTTITAVLFRRSLLDKVGLFRTDCGGMADKFWAIRSACFSDTVFVPGRLATWRYHTGQVSLNLHRGAARQQYELTAATLRECEEFIPARWRTDSGWSERLLAGARQAYLDSFLLNRRAMKESPRRFMVGLDRALCEEPVYALRRVASGFRWDKALLGENDNVRTLMLEWGVPPPCLDRGL